MFDTIKFIIDSDMSGLTRDLIASKFKENGFSVSTHFQKANDPSYLTVDRYCRGELKIALAYHRVSKYTNYPDMIMTFHLSSFNKFHDFITLVKDVFNDKASYVLNEAQLIRVDFCIEIFGVSFRKLDLLMRRRYATVNKFLGRPYESNGW